MRLRAPGRLIALVGNSGVGKSSLVQAGVIGGLKRQGFTVLLVEQNAYAALAIADRGYVLETGRITHSGSGRDLLNDARVREAYLGV